MRYLPLTALFLLPLVMGCFRIEERMVLHADGSGRVHVMVNFPELGIRYLPGKPDRSWVDPNLPRDVEIVRFENRKSQTTFTDQRGVDREIESERFDVELEFGDVHRLNELRVHPDQRNLQAVAAGGAPGMAAQSMEATRPDEPNQSPFQSIEMKSRDGLIYFHRTIQEAQEETDASAAMDLSLSFRDSIEIDLSSSVFVVTIECPGEVIEHNADEIEGRVLTWSFPMDELQSHTDREWSVSFVCRSE